MGSSVQVVSHGGGGGDGGVCGLAVDGGFGLSFWSLGGRGGDSFGAAVLAEAVLAGEHVAEALLGEEVSVRHAGAWSGACGAGAATTTATATTSAVARAVGGASILLQGSSRSHPGVEVNPGSRARRWGFLLLLLLLPIRLPLLAARGGVGDPGHLVTGRGGARSRLSGGRGRRDGGGGGR